MSTEPTRQTYSEHFPGRGVPMDQISGFVERAMAAGAPAHFRARMEDAPANILFGLTAPGTRISVTWTYEPEVPEDDGEPTVRDARLGLATTRGVFADGGLIKPVTEA